LGYHPCCCCNRHGCCLVSLATQIIIGPPQRF
jgi:hypothetical protein